MAMAKSHVACACASASARQIYLCIYWCMETLLDAWLCILLMHRNLLEAWLSEFAHFTRTCLAWRKQLVSKKMCMLFSQSNYRDSLSPFYKLTWYPRRTWTPLSHEEGAAWTCLSGILSGSGCRTEQVETWQNKQTKNQNGISLLHTLYNVVYMYMQICKVWYHVQNFTTVVFVIFCQLHL